MWRMPRMTSVVPTCLALVFAFGAAGCGSDEERPSGAVIAAQRDGQLKQGDRSRLLVPTGELQVFAGEPVTSLDADETRDRTAYDAPAGTAYVPIAWRLRPGRLAPLQRYVAADVGLTVDLATGDDSHRLPPPSSGNGWRSFYAQVDGEGDDARLQVEFDGVTQTLDLRTGTRRSRRATALYRLPDRLTSTTNCQEAATFDMARAAADHDCELTRTALMPYAGGAWAPKGSRWLVVELQTTLTTIAQASRRGDGGAWFTADDVTTTLRAGGSEPDATRGLRNAADVCPRTEDQTCGFAAVARFEVEDQAPRRLAVEQDYRLVRGATWGGYSPKRQRTVRSSGSIDLD